MGPIWRDPRRNSAEFPARDVQNGWMATQLVPKKCDFGSLGVPGPASTPKPTNQPTNQPNHPRALEAAGRQPTFWGVRGAKTPATAPLLSLPPVPISLPHPCPPLFSYVPFRYLSSEDFNPSVGRSVGRSVCLSVRQSVLSVCLCCLCCLCCLSCCLSRCLSFRLSCLPCLPCLSQNAPKKLPKSPPKSSRNRPKIDPKRPPEPLSDPSWNRPRFWHRFFIDFSSISGSIREPFWRQFGCHAAPNFQ